MLLACLGLLVAGCGADAKRQGADGPSPTNPDGTPLVVDDGSTTTAPPPGSNGTPTTRSGGGNGTPTTARRGSSPTTSRTMSPSPNAPDSGAKGGVGAFARTLLRPQPATSIVVEVLVQQGAEPRQSALDHLASTLREVSGKAVSLAGPVAVPVNGDRTSAQQIRELSDRYSRTPHTGSQAVIRLLYLTGEFADEENVIGVAVRGDTAAVFKDAVRAAGSPFAGSAIIEEAVVVHEVGHILGLVDIALDTGRADPEYPGHSRNRGSVMYWAVESRLVAQALGGPPSRTFDADDRTDLTRLRSGA